MGAFPPTVLYGFFCIFTGVLVNVYIYVLPLSVNAPKVLFNSL